MKHFKMGEFACSCCGEVDMDDTLLGMLNEARETAGVPFVITSGFRCEEHNANVGGTKGSAHTLGYAVDIAATNSRNRLVIVQALLKAGFNRIGIAKTFVHVDVDESKPQNVMWVYQ